jgi:hypothetical protein
MCIQQGVHKGNQSLVYKGHTPLGFQCRNSLLKECVYIQTVAHLRQDNKVVLFFGKTDDCSLLLHLFPSEFVARKNQQNCTGIASWGLQMYSEIWNARPVLWRDTQTHYHEQTKPVADKSFHKFTSLKMSYFFEIRKIFFAGVELPSTFAI